MELIVEYKRQALVLKKSKAALESSSYANVSEETVVESRAFSKGMEEAIALTKKRLQSFKSSLNVIRERLQEVGKPHYSSFALQKAMESFEDKLVAFKRAMRSEFDGLDGEEKALEADALAFMSKIESWELEKPERRAEATDVHEKKQQEQQRARNIERYGKHVQLQTQIGAIERQIALLGGRCGGWDSRDHDAFVRVWTQTISISSSSSSTSSENNESTPIYCISPAQLALFKRKAMPLLPGKIEEEVEEHVSWYLTSLGLLATKKNILVEWKDSRLKERSRADENALADFGKKSAESRGGGGGGGNNTSLDSLISEEDKEALRNRIAKWKQEKEEETEKRKNEENARQLAEMQQREEEKRRRQQDNRLQLEQWKKDEAAVKEQIQATEKLVARARSVDPSELHRRQARDLKAAKNRLEKKESRHSSVHARQIRMKELEGKNVNPEVSRIKRDPERLLTTTKASASSQLSGEHLDQAERRRQSASAHSATMAFSARDLQGSRRAVPVWRKPNNF